MHGDDVASAGVSMTTQTATKATEILVELLKLAIDKRREAQRLKQSEEQHEVLSGGEVTYQKLKEGGEITMLPTATPIFLLMTLMVLWGKLIAVMKLPRHSQRSIVGVCN